VNGEAWLRICALGQWTGILQKWQYGFAQPLSTYAASGWRAKHGATILDLAREHIAQTFQYMGTGVQFGDITSHLNAEYKKAGDLETFLNKIVPILEKVTGTTLTVSTDEDE
jgi:hypothetical protein